MLLSYASLLGLDWSDFAMIMAFAGLGIPMLFVLIHLIHRSSPRRRQLDMVDRLLERDDLDPDQRRELVQVVKAIVVTPGFSWSKLIFAAGWFGIFVGGLTLVYSRSYDGEFTGVATIAISFALVTLPLAMREIDNRRLSPGPRHDQT